MAGVAPILVLNAALLGVLWPFGGGDDDNKEKSRRGTIGALDERKVELKQSPDVVDGAALAREQYRRFLELSEGNAELRMEAARRLGDLSMQAGEDAQFDGVVDAESNFYTEAIELYRGLLESGSSYENKDLVLYQLARAYEATGDTDQALDVLDRLVATYPQSIYLAEAQFRRGEILFVTKRYAEAQAAYAGVVRRGDVSNFYEQALYKYGWSLFKQGEHEASLAPFMDLLDLRLAGIGTEDSTAVLDRMSRAERELVDDTFRVLGITFSYLDGVESIDRLMRVRANKAYADMLYAGLGDLYIDKERYTDAAETYAGFVAAQPTHGRSPTLQVKVVEAYTEGQFPSLVLEAKQDFVRLYGLDTAYWAGRAPVDHPAVVAYLKENLTDLASYDHARAQESDDTLAYERAADWYRRYLTYFPDDPDSAERSFLLAEILNELKRYGEATAEYRRAAYNYGAHDRAAEAGYAALLAARQHEAQLEGVAREAWHDETIDASLKFAEAFPGHEQVGPVLTKVAEELFAGGDQSRALTVAGLVVTLQPPAQMELERTAWTVIAHARFDMGSYAEAEAAYRRLRTMPLETPGKAAELDERIAASVYRQAEEAQSAGEVDGAVAQFMRVAESVPDSEIAATAMYDAATLLINNSRWPEAVGALDQFRARFPGHNYQDDVTQKLAVALESADQAGRAAVEYERIATLASLEPNVHREALWQAAELHGAIGDTLAERRVYGEIVARFPFPADESMEARFKLAELAKQSGDFSARQRWLEDIVRADAQAGATRSDRSRTLAARASLELAEPARDAFVVAKLTAPLKDSLKVKKQRMEFALAAYGKAAEYGVGEVTTAATFEIAELYFRLSQDLMNSERPASLSAEEIEQYDILLEEQAFPFEEQAIDIFAANAARAADGVYDDAVRRSFERLAELMPARYGKTERSKGLVAQLD